ncbi:MAG: SCO1664 family protein [Chloroflexi bacterium]|nr:SCO1664 family protein [Chloroflexota bacterium]
MLIDPAPVLDVLREGELEIVGRIVESSNNAMLVTVTRPCPEPEPPTVLHAVYKPTLGERPLDDFPSGTLSKREVAAWFVSEATGWAIVPPTVLRDGPLGEGMVQTFIEVDPTVDVVAMVLDDDRRLRRMATLDAALNNTDRKGGHVLPILGGTHIHGVDHGVCFSPVPKLRTVLWGWRGERFEADEVTGLERIRDGLAGDLGAELRALLSRTEVTATARRVDSLLASGRFPLPSPTWPAIPWPPF